MITRRVCAILVLALIACVPDIAEAGAQNIPCSRPFVFQGAAVNVVVLPYESAPGLSGSGGLGNKLSALMQMEVLRSIAKFGSVGAVQMVGSTADCNPDLVIAKLLGRTPGAATTLTKGNGLIVIWGRFYNEGGNVFVQTFCRLLRSGVDETFELTIENRPFSAQISAQAFVCAPRKVTVADLQNFEEQFLRSTLVRPTPTDGATGTRLPTDPLPYWISDTQGDWMKISSQGGLQGWIRLSGERDTWSLVRWLPELKYIEGMAGYLRYRVAAQKAAPVNPAWLDNAARALSEYEASFVAQATASPDAASALPWRTALAGAVQLQLRGILAAGKPNATTDDRVNAMKLFERAAAMLPQDGNARNLRAVVQLSLNGAGVPGISLKQTADDLLQALGADPGNSRMLANLQGVYEALLAPAGDAGAPLSAAERSEISERIAAIKQIRATRRGSG